MPDILPDPDFEGFDGIYVGSKETAFQAPPIEIDYPALLNYMRSLGKSFDELTQEEIEKFQFD